MKLTEEEALKFYNDTSYDPLHERYSWLLGMPVVFRRSGLDRTLHTGILVGWHQRMTGPMLMVEADDSVMGTVYVRPATVWLKDGL